MIAKGITEAEGVLFRATGSEALRETLDSDKIREEMGASWCGGRSKIAIITTVRVNAASVKDCRLTHRSGARRRLLAAPLLPHPFQELSSQSKANRQFTAIRRSSRTARKPKLDASRHDLSTAGSALAATVMRVQAADRQIFDQMTILGEKINELRNTVVLLVSAEVTRR